MWMGSHDVTSIELPETLIFEFLGHSFPAAKSDACILAIISPEIIDIAALLPRLKFVFIERMGSILTCEEAEIVWKLRV
jgi:hypothetical protein